MCYSEIMACMTSHNLGSPLDINYKRISMSGKMAPGPSISQKVFI